MRGLLGWLMPGKRFTAEQIVAKLREAEKLQGQGLTIPAVCKRLQVSEQTFYRWRTKYGALKEDEAQRLKALDGSMRDELLNGELFHTVLEARVVISEWITSYNSSRPHRGLGMMTPAAFAASQ